MSEKHENPYREGSATHAMFAVGKKKQVISRSEMVQVGISTGKTAKQAKYAADGILSSSKDNVGNGSWRGDLYYWERLPRKTVAGKKEEQKYRLRWRVQALERRVRGEHVGSEKKVAEIKEMVTA
jgi:hypothetical protein